MEERHIVYRSHQTGEQISREEWEAEQNIDKSGRFRPRRREQPQDKEKKRPKISESELEWGGGLKQQKDVQQEFQREKEISSGPFAQYEIADSLDKELRAAAHWDDPLIQMKKLKDSKKVRRQPPLPSSSSSSSRLGSASCRDRDRKSSSPPPTKKCPFPGPPNRYNIAPGARWDGRIRGTGFEDKFLVARSQKEASMRSHIGEDTRIKRF